MYGFRSTFPDGCTENEINDTEAKKCLLCTLWGNAIGQAYQRSDLLEQKTEVMQKGADTVFPNCKTIAF